MSRIARWKCHDTDRLLALEIFLQYHLYAVVFAHGNCRIYWNSILPVSVYACVSKDAYSSCCGDNTFCNPILPLFVSNFDFLSEILGVFPDRLLQINEIINTFDLYHIGGKIVGSIPIMLVVYPILSILMVPLMYHVYHKTEIK